MAYIKTKEEIKQILKGGKILGSILEKLAKAVRPGVSTLEIDQLAEKLIKKAGGKPAFKGYKGRKSDPPFPTTICACVNEELVHGIARADQKLKNGDVFSIDIGMEYPSPKFIKSDGGRGYFTDTAITVIVGDGSTALTTSVPEKTRELMRVTREALEVGIGAAKPGNTVADIGRAIEQYVKSQGNYGIVRDLVGHGVGHAVHEEPRVPNYYDKDMEKWVLEPGVVIAIEPMIAISHHAIETAEDGWTVRMKDKSLCAHFEHTVIITEDGNKVATRRPAEL